MLTKLVHSSQFSFTSLRIFLGGCWLLQIWLHLCFSLEFDVLGIESDGGVYGLKNEYFNPYDIDRQNIKQIKLTSGVVHVIPKGEDKATAVDKYNMTSFPHGIALIINNERFARQSYRAGTQVDERNLIHTFRTLGYKVEVHRNLDSKEMLAIMTEMGTRKHTHCDSFVCCILSHGMEGHFCGTDSVMVSVRYLKEVGCQPLSLT